MKQNDFKIIEFKNSFNDLFVLIEDWLYYCNEINECEGFTLNSMLERSYTIHKVKCISTGEIFIVGDNANKGKIERFYIVSEKMIVDNIVDKKQCFVLYESCYLHELTCATE